MPPRVGKPSLEIAAIAGRKEASRAELKKLLWTYIKNNNLQCENPKRYSKFGVSLKDIGLHLFSNPTKNAAYVSLKRLYFRIEINK